MNGIPNYSRRFAYLVKCSLTWYAKSTVVVSWAISTEASVSSETFHYTANVTGGFVFLLVVDVMLLSSSLLLRLFVVVVVLGEE